MWHVLVYVMAGAGADRGVEEKVLLYDDGEAATRELLLHVEAVGEL